MSPEAMFNLHSGFLLLTCGLFSLIVPFGWAQQQRNNKPDEFSCPEEFGYYPHPSDCTQYYVCVFGGAILESCTGGLMYSHDLQTCDWPRNVGCGQSPASAANSLNTVSTASGSNPDLGNRYTTPSWKHEIPQPQQDEIPDRHLYEEEDLGPVEEIESDRQQRVYRGQPPTLGQVARDRDGIARHANALQTSAGPEKIKPVAVVSFGSHHQSLSKGNTTTQSTHIEQNEDDKLEINRVKRDLRNSTTENRKSRTNDGYGLRYRLQQNGDPVPTDASNIQTYKVTTFKPPNTSQNTLSFSKTQFSTFTTLRPPNSSQNTLSSSKTQYTTITGNMRLIKLPTTTASPTAQTTSHPYATLGWSSRATTPRTHYSNPLVSGSSRYNRYANSENLGDFTATDFSVVSVAPTSNTRPNFRHRFTTPSPPMAMSYDYRTPNYHSTMYTEIPNHAVATQHHAIHNFPNPHNFRRNQVNNYYGSAGPPRFIPYAPPPPFPSYPYPYSPPETAIVTLTYPNSSPVGSMTEYLTQPPPSTTEMTTSPPVTTTTASVAQNVTEKPQINATKLQEGESEHHPQNSKKRGRKPSKNNAHSNSIGHSKDDFEGDDEEEHEFEEDKVEPIEEEPEEEEPHENEDFEVAYNFEDENEPSETNQTVRYSAKKPTPVQDKKKESDENENEEADLEYVFEEEPDGIADDEAEKQEEKKEDEEDDTDDKGDEKDEEENDIKKPASSFHKRYITDELDNPFAKPDFDFNSYLTDLAKPIKVPGEETQKKAKKSKKPPANRTLGIEGENAESNVRQNISRKNDRIVRLHLYDALPEAIVKRTRATKPGQAPKRVVPMALVHSYKPANYSYPTRYHLHSPSNYNYKTSDNYKYDKPNNYKPFSFGTSNYSYPDYPKYENPSGDSNQQNASDYSDEGCANDDSACNQEDDEYANAEEEEEEEDAPAGNNDNASVQDNEEYYDDSANDYGPEHLNQPPTGPKAPSIPNEMKNIDKEVTAPPVNFDDTEEQSEGNEEDENANNEEETGNESEEPQEGNEEEQEYVDDSQQPNTDGEESVLSSQQYKTPKKSSHYNDKGTVSIVDQVMIPHRQNKYLQNPATELSNQVSTFVTKPSYNVTTQPTTNSYQMTTYRTPLMRSTLTTPYYTKLKQNFNYKDKIKPSFQVNKTRTTDYYKFQPPANPTSSYTSTSNVVTHPLPTHKTEPRYGNKTKSIYHKFPNEGNTKSNNKTTDTSSRPRPTMKPTTANWPPPSVPPYILEHSVPPVPTTPKSVYNVTKFEPYYNVYDDEAEIYRDIDYGQYNQRNKQQDSYQVIQEPHRLQPVQPQSQPSQILTSPPSYNNQDYKLQSDIDGDTQQSEKLPSTRLFLGHNETSSTLSRHENNKPIAYFPFIRSAFSPVVDFTNNNKQLKLTASFQLGAPNGVRNATVNNFRPNDLPYETVRSYELNFHNDDSIIGETSQLPAKVTSFTRKFQPFNISSTTVRIPKATTTSPIRNFKTPSIRDNFRIIVEPVNSISKKPTPPIAFTSKPTFSPDNAIFTYKLPSTDKFSATYRSLGNIFSTTYTPYSIIQLQTTTTTTTTTSKPTTSSASPDSEKQTSNANSRRFYIPRNDLIERKLSLTPTTTPNTPPLPKTDSVKATTKQINLTNKDSHNRIVHSTTPSTLTENNKEGEENEILYYDDEYYDDGETPENNDNYIDNKISEFSTSTYANDVPKPKPSTVSKPKLTKVPFSSTAINVPKSPLQIPNESSTNSLKVEAETKRPHRYKESYSERCPQCNEKPSGRGRNRGSVTYTTGGNEYEATPASGRARPTLKPSALIVGKASESIDIYKHAPKRPDTVYPTPQVDKVAAKCRKDICLLPDCSCGGKDIPGDLPVEETPQLVLLTFDDSVNELNRGLYTDLFEKGRTNPNGCPISATFYVSHEWTDYSMVQNLYASGHEIASHSVSHSFGEQFSQRKWTKEIVGQREILSAYGGVKQEDIRGMRAPFLAVGGNKMFKMLYDANFTYDSSMPIYENRPPSWPYTLDYKIFHDCMIPPCPTRSYPGVWEVPMVMWQDLNGGRCSMGDACSNPPNADGVYKMLIKNFERHFTTNRAPFGLFYHSSWFTQPHHKEGFIAFLDTIVNMPEVWLVTNWQAIQWARDPTPISRLNSFTPFNCDYPDRPRRCNNAKVCNLWHKSGVRYLKTCQPCPDVYPWTGKTGVRNSRVDNDDTLVE